MSNFYLISILKSHYCKTVFVLSFLGSYFLIPATIFKGWHIILGVLFMLSFSFTTTCLTRNIKEKVKLARNYKNSLLGIFATVIGFSALQVCGIGAPVCGASIGAGILSFILPGFFMGFLIEYGVHLVVFSILIQLVALYKMKCFIYCGRCEG